MGTRNCPDHACTSLRNLQNYWKMTQTVTADCISRYLVVAWVLMILASVWIVASWCFFVTLLEEDLVSVENLTGHSDDPIMTPSAKSHLRAADCE